MIITLSRLRRAGFSCTSIVELEGARHAAAPFFMARDSATANANAPETKGMSDMESATERQPIAAGGRRKSTFTRRGVVSRLWHAAEKQVGEIETRLAALGDDPQALEREAKTLAIVARTVRDLVALDAEAQAAAARNKAAASKGKEADDAHAGPRAIEDFRAELARRLDELRRERGGGEAS